MVHISMYDTTYRVTYSTDRFLCTVTNTESHSIVHDYEYILSEIQERRQMLQLWIHTLKEAAQETAVTTEYTLGVQCNIQMLRLNTPSEWQCNIQMLWLNTYFQRGRAINRCYDCEYILSERQSDRQMLNTYSQIGQCCDCEYILSERTMLGLNTCSQRG